MKVLIDSNILIAREDPKILSTELAKILQLASLENTFSIIIHPACIEDIEQDRNISRRKITLSKLQSYTVLKPTTGITKEYIKTVQTTNSRNDIRDDRMLCSLFVGDVAAFITNDRGIHKKAKHLNLEQSVLDVNEAHTYLKKLFSPSPVSMPAHLDEVAVSELDINDAFFDSLKNEYSGFLDWWEKICRFGRRCIIYSEEKNIKALLITDVQDQTIHLKDGESLQKKFRLKICTLKVARTGLKLGELFIKKSIQMAMQKQLEEVFLTHFTKDEDLLVDLITEYGFKKAGESKNGESIYIKSIIPKDKDINNYPSKELIHEYYPYYLDDERINKFMIPIQPEYHNRLFPEYNPNIGTQLQLFNKLAINPEGNTIKKAYICNSPIKKMKVGDLVIFYLSKTKQAASVLGVIESIHYDEKDLDSIYRHIGKRTVYSSKELKEICQKKSVIILFLELHYIDSDVDLDFMTKNNILKGPPQSIVKLNEDSYKQIKKSGFKNGNFTLN